MPTTVGSVRRLVLTPALVETTFERRGFAVEATEATRRLEAIPQAVICGFEWGIDTRSQWELERRLELVDAEQRGFAYEGATMACTVLDVAGPRRGHRTRDLMSGPGRPHVFLTYIGIGFAMARLPRPLWKRVLPDLTGTPYHPLMSWLAVDGYGFDRAYFDTDRYVGRQLRPAAYPWLGQPDYFARAVDQGIGRALWFIAGARPEAVASAVRRFAAQRRADLWAGVGLAATVAGGCDAAGFGALLRLAGPDAAADLGQGAVFGAKARTYAGFVPEHTARATAAFAGLSVPAATALADDVTAAVTARPDAQPGADYEALRGGIRAALHALRPEPVPSG
jgi:enediyne biosynthesis protein E2